MKKFTLSGAVVSLLLGCSGSGSATALTKVTTLDAGMACPAGGVTISVGLDANGNGTLDDSEVKDSSDVCNGQNGTGTNGMNGTNGFDGRTGPTGATGMVGVTGTSAAQPLFKTSTLAAGDSNCAAGGAQIEYGLDNGRGGGTANNKSLEAGEVLDTRYVCNGGAPYFVTSLTPPAAPAGAYQVTTLAGAGAAAGAGLAGSVTVHMLHGSMGGAVKIFKTGNTAVPTVMPSIPTFNAGALRLEVTTDLTLRAFPSISAGLASGDTYFQQVNAAAIFQNVAGTAARVTSLSVAAGVTLTLPIVQHGTDAAVSVGNDISNDGIITAPRIGADGASMFLQCSVFVSGAQSSIIATGAAVTGLGTFGGHGGEVHISTDGMLFNRGAISTSGGAGESGGDGVAVFFSSDFSAVVNTGMIDTHGGTPTTGRGGNGGPIDLKAQQGALINAGNLFTRGANGVAAGHGGGVFLTAGNGLVNSTLITTSGGNCTGAQCTGENAGAVNAFAKGGETFWNTTVTANGGDGVLSGGNAGELTIRGIAEDFGGTLTATMGSIHVSGSVQLNGGEAAQGGNGGQFIVELDPKLVARGQSIELLGYTLIDASGAASVNGLGSSGGGISFFTDASSLPGGIPGPGGAIFNDVNLTSNGGDGTRGATPGTVLIHTQQDFDFSNANEVAINAGVITLTGGVSSTTSPQRGDFGVEIYGLAGAENRGAITATGGSASGGPIEGMSGGLVNLYSFAGPVNNTGNLQLSGGTSSELGGEGGFLSMQGTVVTNSGPVTARGGNSSMVGGEGGGAFLLASTRVYSSTGTYDFAGGLGASPASSGEPGQLLIDGAVAP